ncbi:MAG: hypothetical protein JSS66_03265 [Armatimonadetes bacterium]|nr:hypothetical protein [Armatimonadota bacterium]
MQPESPAPKARTMREIDLGVIAEGFNLVWKNIGPFLVLSIVYCGIQILLSQVFGLALRPMIGAPPTNTQDFGELFAYMQKSYAVQYPLSLIINSVLAPFSLSICMMTLKLARGQTIDVSDGFKGFEAFLPAATAYLTISILSTLGLIGCFVGSFVVYGLLMFTFPLMADQKLAPMAAITESFSMLKKHWVMAAVFVFVTGLCVALGLLACCVGILVTMPLMFVCPTLVYRDFTMGRGAVAPQPAPIEGA